MASGCADRVMALVLIVVALDAVDGGDQGLEVLNLDIVEILAADLVLDDLHGFILRYLRHPVAFFALLENVLRVGAHVLIHLDDNSSDLIVELVDQSDGLGRESHLVLRLVARLLCDLLYRRDVAVGAHELHQVGL